MHKPQTIIASWQRMKMGKRKQEDEQWRRRDWSQVM